jgi:hypothetical protein
VQRVQALDGVEHVRVADLGIEDLFKDFIKGHKTMTANGSNFSGREKTAAGNMEKSPHNWPF